MKYLRRRLKAAWRAFRDYRPFTSAPAELPKRRTCEEAHAAVGLPGDDVWVAVSLHPGRGKPSKPILTVVKAQVMRTWLAEAGECKAAPHYRVFREDGETVHDVDGLHLFTTREGAYQWLEKNGLLRLEDVMDEAIKRAFMRDILTEPPETPEATHNLDGSPRT